MIRLTPNEAKTYEGIKNGLSVKEISDKNGLCTEAIRHQIRFLMSIDMVVRSGMNNKSFTYTVIDKPYYVEKKTPAPRTKPEPMQKVDDPFLDRAINATITDDQHLYLINHKGKLSRKVLAKRTGLTKLQLNFALERLG